MQPPASGNFYFPALDGLRALAIFWVIIYHSWWVSHIPPVVVSIGGTTLNLTPVFGVGFIGVYLFFVLSGFLLSFPFLRACFQQKPFPSVRKYYLRRILRIVPAFYAAVLLQVILGTPHWFLGGAEAWRTIPAHLTFLFNFSGQSQSAINGVFWTLSVEMQFYIMLPLIMYLVYKRKALFTTIAIIAIGLGWRFIVFRIYTTNSDQVIFYGEHQFPYHLLLFGIGIVMAAIYLWIHYRKQWVERLPRRMAALGLGLSLIGILTVWWSSYRMISTSVWSGGIDYYLLPIGVALGFGCLLLGALYAPVLIRRIWTNNFARLIGIVSYGMYLWHFPILYWISTWAWEVPPAAPQQLQTLLVMGLAASVLVGLASLVLIERPFIRWGARKQRSVLSSVAPQPIVDT